MSIPINIETLLSGSVVESERIEFKKGWNPSAVMRTVAAFANDFENLGSGYIVVGIEEEDGMAKRPVFGFPPEQFDTVQKNMLGYGNLMRPPYFPRLSLVEVDGKHVLLIWVTAGSNRPYEVPREITARIKDYQYYIRRYSSTVIADQDQRNELISLTANIPFDDRVNTHKTVDDISLSLMQQHLRAIGSKLYEESKGISQSDLCKQMNLAEGADEHLFPKNVGLLMFNEHPEQYFPETQINLVEFPNGLDGSEFYEKHFPGPIQLQLSNALSYIKSQVIKSKTVKIKGEAESKSFFNYPFEAIEEALSNAVYHRNYEIREPIEVRILPDAFEIISYGGPDPSIRQRDLDRGVIRARRYRNRRIGEFLKELNLTEGKGTGIPTIRKAMIDNGSPLPLYDMDGDDRRFFIAELPVHSEFLSSDWNQDEIKGNTFIISDKEELNQVRNQVRNQVGNQVKDQIIDRVVFTIQFCMEAKTKNEILEELGLSKQSKYFIENIGPAIKNGLIEMTIPDKPTSKNQKYITTILGKELIERKK